MEKKNSSSISFTDFYKNSPPPPPNKFATIMLFMCVGEYGWVGGKKWRKKRKKKQQERYENM